MPTRALLDLLDGQPGTAPRREAARNLGCSGAKRQLRAHGVLAEIHGALTVRLHQMAAKRYLHRAWRRPVSSPRSGDVALDISEVE